MLATQELISEASQPTRVAAALPAWLREVPLYRDRPQPEVPGPVPLAQLPLITKTDIRANFPANFLGPEANLEDMVQQELIELEQTSGTSEQQRTPLLLPWGWWQQQELIALRLNSFIAGLLGGEESPKRVTISSPVCNSEVCYTGVPAKADRIVGQTLFASLSRFPFLWGEADLERIARETAEWAPLFLDVDPVYGVAFARFCERRGLRFPSLRFVLCSYEFLSINHRRVLERAFGVPVLNLYGSTETGHLLMQTPQNLMQPSLGTAHLELLNPDERGVGDLVVTTLSNPFMPLIRYRIGDLAERFETPYRTHYVLHGRALDAFTAPSGRRVTVQDVDCCFTDLYGFAHYQLSGPGPDGWRLRFIPDLVGPTLSATSDLSMRLTDLLEATSGVAVEPAEALMAENSGKFRLVHPIPGSR